MRPEILYPMFKTIDTLPGIGPRNTKLMERVTDGPHVVDLIWHLPTGLIDRSFQPLIKDAPAGRIATLSVTVDKHIPAANRRLPYKVICSDPTGIVELVFFHAHVDWLEKELPVGAERVVSGKVEHYHGRVQITHPDHIGAPEERETLAGVEAVYGLTQGLSPKTLGRAMGTALGDLPGLPEWLDPAHQTREGWPSWKDAILATHGPSSEADLISNTTPIIPSL